MPLLRLARHEAVDMLLLRQMMLPRLRIICHYDMPHAAMFTP